MKSMIKSNGNKADADLVLAYQSGNHNAFAELVKRWHLEFCNFAYWYVKDADVAKDIAQESWMIIYNKLDGLNQPHKFKSWAISIVNRKAIDWIRASNREHKKRNTFYDENSEKEVFMEERSDRNNLKVFLKKEIEKLPSNQKIVIGLFYTEGYSISQISEILNVSIGTTKSRLFHAREKLKSTLKHRNYG